MCVCVDDHDVPSQGGEAASVGALYRAGRRIAKRSENETKKGSVARQE